MHNAERSADEPAVKKGRHRMYDVYRYIHRRSGDQSKSVSKDNEPDT